MPGGILSIRETNALRTVRIEVDGYHFVEYNVFSPYMREVMRSLALCLELELIVLIPGRASSRFTGCEGMSKLMEQDALDALNSQVKQMAPQKRRNLTTRS